MMLDNALMFSDEQDVTADADSSSYLDLKTATDLGANGLLYLFLRFGTVVSNATLATTLSGDDDAAGTSAVTVLVTPTITPVTNSFVAFPIRSHTPKRYFKLAYDITGGTSPHIPVTATLVNGRQVRTFSRAY